MARRPPPRYSDRRSNPSPSPSSPSLGSKINYGTIALFGGIFVLGIGVGIGVTSMLVLTPKMSLHGKLSIKARLMQNSVYNTVQVPLSRICEFLSP